MNILHLDASIRSDQSVSRLLSADIVARQRALHPQAQLTYRDLAADPGLHLSPAHLDAFHGAAVADAALGADLGKGSAYLQELVAADLLVIGAPMYNFSVPSQLKAWIDRVVIPEVSFRYTAQGVQSLLPPGKRVFIASARGNRYPVDGSGDGREHQESYLRSVLSFLGMTDITVIRAEGLMLGDEARDAAVRAARQAAAQVA